MACTRNTNNEPLYVYVNALGSDTNPGLRPTQAVKTVGKAIEIIEQYDLTNFGATIFVASGTYTDDIILRETLGGQGVSLAGSGSTILNCQISGTDLTSTFTFTGVTLRQTNPAKSLVTLSNASVTLTDCTLELLPTSNSSVYPLIALNGALISLSGTLDIIYNGAYSCPGWCYAGAISTIEGEGLIVVTTGTNIWNSAGVYVAAGAVANLQGMVLTDTIRGTLWNVEAGGTLYLIPLVTSLPGDTLGTGGGTIAPKGIIGGGGTSFNNILFEAVRTTSALSLTFPQNQITNPEGFEKTGSWTYTGITVDTTPTTLKYDLRGDGYPWMDLLKETAVTSVHSVKQTVSVLGQAMVLQVYGRTDGSLARTKCFIRLSSLDGTNAVRAIYDIATGVVSGVTATGAGVHTSSSCTTNGVIGSCILSCSIPDDGDSVVAEYGIASDATTIDYLGDIANGLFLQGASLTLGTDIGAYQYADTGVAEITFATANPGAFQTALSGGVLEVPAGTLTGTIGGITNEIASFAITETANRGCIISSSISSVTSGGNNSDIIVTNPFTTLSFVDSGDSALVTITTSATGSLSAKTLGGFFSVNYLDINSLVQTVTKSFSLVTQVLPTVSNVRLLVGGANLSNGQIYNANFTTGLVSCYVWCTGCSPTNILNASGLTITTQTGGWSGASFVSTAISLGTSGTSGAARIDCTTTASAGTLTVQLTFVEIAGTFTFTLVDTV